LRITVTHNTISSVYWASRIKLKVGIICHRSVIIDQWRQAFEKYSTAIVQVVTPAKALNQESDVYIFSVDSVAKKDISAYKDIGFLIYDEAHATMCTKVSSNTIFYFQPQYMLALTATPERSDGMNKIINLTIGETCITRKLKALFNVYIVYTSLFTKYKVKVEANSQGGLDWNYVLESQALSIERNKLIIDLCLYFQARTILILCKRKDQCEILFKILKKYNQDVDTYYGSNKYLNYNCRILIATYSKGGTGMDVPNLDLLIVASDVEEGYRQYCGRIFRRDNQVPIILDLIDAFRPLQNHAETRLDICKEIGASVKRFDKCFSDFNQWRNLFNVKM
jgi:superfamily II DNA or RNA helicase